MTLKQDGDLIYTDSNYETLEHEENYEVVRYSVIKLDRKSFYWDVVSDSVNMAYRDKTQFMYINKYFRTFIMKV